MALPPGFTWTRLDPLDRASVACWAFKPNRCSAAFGWFWLETPAGPGLTANPALGAPCLALRATSSAGRVLDAISPSNTRCRPLKKAGHRGPEHFWSTENATPKSRPSGVSRPASDPACAVDRLQPRQLRPPSWRTNETNLCKTVHPLLGAMASLDSSPPASTLFVVGSCGVSVVP